jgi:dUTP pyrophosphatase
MKVLVKKLDPRAVIPSRATDGAAGFDITAIDIKSDFPLYGEKTFRTGLAFDIPDGFAMLVFSRSGHGFKENTRLANCVGVVDSDYTGELFVKLTRDDGLPVTARHGDRVAQAVFLRLPDVDLVETDELKQTERGDKGLGSTGK